MMHDEFKTAVSIAFAVCLLLGFCVMKGCEYNTKELDARKACVLAGHTPLECGLVHVQ